VNETTPIDWLRSTAQKVSVPITHRIWVTNRPIQGSHRASLVGSLAMKLSSCITEQNRKRNAKTYSGIARKPTQERLAPDIFQSGKCWSDGSWPASLHEDGLALLFCLLELLKGKLDQDAIILWVTTDRRLQRIDFGCQPSWYWPFVQKQTRYSSPRSRIRLCSQ